MKNQPKIDKVYRPLKSIRLFCIYCMGGQITLVPDCPSKTSCFLWPYRMGKRPDKIDFNSPNPIKRKDLKI
jgi:hypothetical protein